MYSTIGSTVAEFDHTHAHIHIRRFQFEYISGEWIAYSFPIKQ